MCDKLLEVLSAGDILSLLEPLISRHSICPARIARGCLLPCLRSATCAYGLCSADAPLAHFELACSAITALPAAMQPHRPASP